MDIPKLSSGSFIYHRLVSCCLIPILILTGVLFTRMTAAEEVEKLMEMSLESLMQIEVTSVAKKPQSLEETTAAVYVITRDEIQRAGATTIAEALRLAPGVHVAQTSSNQWAIAVRGFNGYLSNKLLVLIDGRSVYTPIFSGVYWNQQDVMLADVDRIEIIRGPGGTLWGANAVNGVINIITSNSKKTQGGLLEIGGGNLEQPVVSLRYGGKLNEESWYRVYAKHNSFNNFKFSDGTNLPDDWQHTQIGGRIDWKFSELDVLTLQGDAYYGDHGNLFKFPTTSFIPPIQPGLDSANQYGANIMAKWEHKTTAGGKVNLNAYYDRVGIHDETPSELIETWDLDFQYQFSWSDNIEILWGLGYRRVTFNSKPRLAFSINADKLNLFSGFVQGDIELTDSMRMTLGSKFEHNEFTGFEWQPNARLLWQLHENESFWFAVSRAVRTPSPAEDSGSAYLSVIPGMPPLLARLIGNQDLDSEELISYELGYRGLMWSAVSLDITSFYNDYDKLIDVGILQPVFENSPFPPHILLPQTWKNNIYGKSYGIEAVVNWHPKHNWRLEVSYSLLELDMHRRDTVGFTNNPQSGPLGLEGGSPNQQFQIRSYLDLPHNLNFDAVLHWVDELPSVSVKEYLRADLHLGWRPLPALSMDLFLRNLLDNRHKEDETELYVAGEVPRSVLIRATWEW